MDGIVRIQHCAEFGDYVVADKDFNAEEIMFSEKPIYTWPKSCVADQKDDFSCLGCLEVNPSPMKKCPKCLWPVCSISCSKAEEHSCLECKLFQTKGILFQTEFYAYLRILRVLLSKEVFPGRYAKLMTLTSQFGDTGQSYSDLAQEDSIAAWKFLTEICDMAVPLDDVIKIRSTIAVNNFSNNFEDKFGHEYRGELVYHICCKMSHSCSPSVYWRFERVINIDKTVLWNLRLYSRREIKKGDLVSIAYSPDGLDYGTGQRRQKHKNFTFSCLCSRCVDPTEEGSFFSSFVCENLKCQKGFMLPLEPLDSLVCDWQCQKCESVLSGSEVKAKITEFEDFVRNEINQPVTEDSLHRLDEFITTNSGKTLHKNHWLIFMSSEFWLTENDFTRQLVEKSKKSKKLFRKIMERANRTLSLNRKFLGAPYIASTELFMATTMGEHLFKTEDFITLDTSGMDLRKQLRYSKSILRHCQASFKWLQIGGLECSIVCCQIWHNKCDMLTGKIKKQDRLMEKKAFAQIASLLG